MTQTVFGLLADPVGLASKQVLEQGSDRPELRRRSWATPAGQVRDVQAAKIPIDQDHDQRWVGEIIHLERGPGGNLWAVGHVSDDVLPVVNVRVGDELFSVETDLYWSASRLGTPACEDIIVDSISLTAHPARVSARPVTFLDGDLNYRRAVPDRWQVSGYQRDLLTRAAKTNIDRERDTPLYVYDDDGDLDNITPTEAYIRRAEQYEDRMTTYSDRRPPGKMIIRPGGPILSVR